MEINLKSISGTSNPERWIECKHSEREDFRKYIVGSISDSQLNVLLNFVWRYMYIGDDLHIVFVKCGTIVQRCEFRRPNIKSAKAKQIQSAENDVLLVSHIRVGVKNRCRVSSPDEPSLLLLSIDVVTLRCVLFSLPLSKMPKRICIAVARLYS
ncbi:hypothetical protein T01_4483 [Trichinella spiralis]|uniref:Uncharacterized protein n=1 Tax=Trichinella spiralis TaxID=6334 RepID=A0A0V1BVY6_TRISP|nr:hypothetical protein T01_4483 [Trichinella spiralis]